MRVTQGHRTFKQESYFVIYSRVSYAVYAMLRNPQERQSLPASQGKSIVYMPLLQSVIQPQLITLPVLPSHESASPLTSSYLLRGNLPAEYAISHVSEAPPSSHCGSKFAAENTCHACSGSIVA